MAKIQPRYGRVANPYGRLQAIVTCYFGPTNTRGARVKATAEAGSVMLRWDDALDSYGNHVKACEALIAKLGWAGQLWYGGAMASGGYVFVDTDIPE